MVRGGADPGTVGLAELTANDELKLSTKFATLTLPKPLVTS